MGLFNSKKKTGDNLRILSENEIQKKLYGGLIPEDELKKRNETAWNSSKAQEDLVAQESHQPTVAVKEKRGVGVVEDELFSRSSHESVNPSTNPSSSAPKNNVPSAKPEVKKNQSSAQIKNWVTRENQAVDSFVANKPQKKYGKEKKARKPIFSLVILPVIKKVFSAIGAILHFLVGGLIAFVLSLDFRRPGVQRAAGIFAGIFFLLVIFFGVHILNTQREIAMKQPPKKKPVVASVVPSGQEVASVSSEGNTTTSDQVDANKTGSGTQDAKLKKKKAAAQPANTETANATPVKPQTPAVSEKTGQMGYVIQVATYAIESDADNLVKQFKDEGIQAFTKMLTRPSGKQYYCVFMGWFQDYAQAEQALISFRKKPAANPFQDAFIRSLARD